MSYIRKSNFSALSGLPVKQVLVDCVFVISPGLCLLLISHLGIAGFCFYHLQSNLDSSSCLLDTDSTAVVLKEKQ